MLWTKLTIPVWIIMRITRKITDSSLDVFNANQSQASIMQSTINHINLKFNPVCKVYIYNADQF